MLFSLILVSWRIHQQRKLAIQSIHSFYICTYIQHPIHWNYSKYVIVYRYQLQFEMIITQNILLIMSDRFYQSQKRSWNDVRIYISTLRVYIDPKIFKDTYLYLLFFFIKHAICTCTRSRVST